MMRQQLDKWLKRQKIDLSVDTAHSICSSLGLEGEKLDGCYMLVADLEQGRIGNSEFTAGISVLTGKEPEEIMRALGGMKAKAVPEAEIRAEVPEVKEPWQMTEAEFKRKALSETFPEATFGEKPLAQLTDEEVIATANAYFLVSDETMTHKKLVEQALREGKPVPTEVLKDYPDLNPQAVEE